MSDHCESNRLNFFITWYVELKITKKISRKKVRIKIKNLPRNDHKYIDICLKQTQPSKSVGPSYDL